MSDFFDNFPLPSANRPELDARAEEAASKATCKRCGVLILQDSSASGLVLGRIIVPGVNVNISYQLCGKCGLALQEFLCPGLVTEREYMAVKTQLLQEHWS